MLDLDMCYNMDCLDGMKLLETNSVDVSFTSPPYNDLAHKRQITDDNEIIVKDGHNTHTKYKYVDTRDDWYEWQCEVIDEMLRVTKKYVLYNIQGIKNNREDLYKLIGKYSSRIHDILIWYKPNGAPTCTPHKISNKYEMVLILRCDGITGVDVNSDLFYNVINKPINSSREFSKIHHAVMSEDFCNTIISEFCKPK